MARYYNVVKMAINVMMMVRMLTLSAQQDHSLPTDRAQYLFPLSHLLEQHVAIIDI